MNPSRTHGMSSLLLLALVLLLAVGYTSVLASAEQATGCNVSIVFVLDTSGSMDWPISSSVNMSRIDGLKQAVKTFINMTPEGGSFQVHIVRFSDYAWNVTPGLITIYNESSKQYLTSMVDSLVADGATNMGDGLLLAEKTLRNATTEYKIVILVSDGEPNTGPDPVLIADQLKSEGIILVTVFLGDDPYARDLMSMLATSQDHFFDVVEYNFSYQAIFNKILAYTSCARIIVRGEPGTLLQITGNATNITTTIPSSGTVEIPVNPGELVINYTIVPPGSYSIIGNTSKLQGFIKVNITKNSIKIVDIPKLYELVSKVNILIKDTNLANRSLTIKIYDNQNNTWELQTTLDNNGQAQLQIYATPGEYTIQSTINQTNCGPILRVYDNFTATPGANITLVPTLPYVDRNSLYAKITENYVIPIVSVVNQKHEFIKTKIFIEIIDNQTNILYNATKTVTLLPGKASTIALDSININNLSENTKIFINYKIYMNNTLIDCSPSPILIAVITGNDTLYNLLLTLKESINTVYKQYSNEISKQLENYINSYIYNVYPYVANPDQYSGLYSEVNIRQGNAYHVSSLIAYHASVNLRSLPLPPVELGSDYLATDIAEISKQIVYIVINNYTNNSEINIRNVTIHIDKKQNYIELNVSYENLSLIIKHLVQVDRQDYMVDLKPMKGILNEAKNIPINVFDPSFVILNIMKNVVIDSLINNTPDYLNISIIYSNERTRVNVTRTAVIDGAYFINVDAMFRTLKSENTIIFKINNNSVIFSYMTEYSVMYIDRFNTTVNYKIIRGNIDYPRLSLSEISVGASIDGEIEFAINFEKIGLNFLPDLSLDLSASLELSVDQNRDLVLSIATSDIASLSVSSEESASSSQYSGSGALSIKFKSEAPVECLGAIAADIPNDARAAGVLLMYATYPIVNLLKPVPILGFAADLYLTTLGRNIQYYNNSCIDEVMFSKAVSNKIGREVEIKLPAGVRGSLGVEMEYEEGVEWSPRYSLESASYMSSSAVSLSLGLGMGAGIKLPLPGDTLEDLVEAEASIGISLSLSYSLGGVSVSDPVAPSYIADYSYIDYDNDNESEYIDIILYINNYNISKIYVILNSTNSSIILNSSKINSNYIDLVIPSTLLLSLGSPGDYVNVSTIVLYKNNSIENVTMGSFMIPYNLSNNISDFINIIFIPKDINNDNYTDELFYIVYSRVPYNVSVRVYPYGELTYIASVSIPAAASYLTGPVVVVGGNISESAMPLLAASNFSVFVTAEILHNGFRIPVYLDVINLSNINYKYPWSDVGNYIRIYDVQNYIVFEYYHNYMLPSFFDYILNISVNGETNNIKMIWTSNKIYVLMPKILLNGTVNVNSLDVYYGTMLVDRASIGKTLRLSTVYFRIIDGIIVDGELLLNVTKVTSQPLFLDNIKMFVIKDNDSIFAVSTSLINIADNSYKVVLFLNESLANIIENRSFDKIIIYGYDPSDNLVLYTVLSGDDVGRIIQVQVPSNTTTEATDSNTSSSAAPSPTYTARPPTIPRDRSETSSAGQPISPGTGGASHSRGTSEIYYVIAISIVAVMIIVLFIALSRLRV